MSLTITPGQTSATVEWGQVVGAVQYEIKFSTLAAGAAVISVAYVNEPTRTYSKTGLVASKDYWVRVLPIDENNADMTDLASAWVKFTTTA